MIHRFKKRFIFLISLMLLFLYAYNIEPRRLVVREKHLELSNWDNSLNGLKVAVVGDLHIGTRKVPLKKVEKVVKAINEQNPDLILILGDFDSFSINYSKIPHSEITKTLAELDASLGVFAVLGNHDYEPSGVIEPILQNAGIKLLRNESKSVVFSNERICICGIEDIWHHKVYPKSVLGEVNEPTLFLSHNPDIFPKVPKEVSLTLSGHTHGGEVALPLIGAPFVPSAYGQKYSKGYIVEDGKSLLVTSGIGCLSRLRFFNPPEIVILNLYSKESNINDEKLATGLINKLILPYNKRKYQKALKITL